ncbi:MAG: hypothetical protein QM742_09775 [Aquabacterium sp.]
MATVIQPGLRVEGSNGDDVLHADAWANNVVVAGAGNDTCTAAVMAGTGPPRRRRRR